LYPPIDVIVYVDESSLVKRAETDKKVTALFVIQSNMEN